MEYLAEYGMFLAKAITLVVAVLFVVGSIVSLGQRHRPDHEGHLEVRHLNERYKALADSIREIVLNPDALKRETKQEKKDEKARLKAEKKAGKKGNNAVEIAKRRVFVLNFDGDMRASATDALREEISAVLRMAVSSDEVLLRLESGGGLVHSYGLAASQVRRVVDQGVPLTVSVDKVAASGGYMMACVANRIIAAPFAVIGSIGVLAQIPNFHRLLKDNKIDLELHTAGEHKRTLTMFGENTESAREKFLEELEDTHQLFKSFVSENRPQVDIASVATGEVWFGQRALENQLVDELKTSDSYICEAIEDAEVYELRYVHRRSWQEKLGFGVEGAIERIGTKLWYKAGEQPRW